MPSTSYFSSFLFFIVLFVVNIDFVSGVTDMSYMFREASSFNNPMNNWNVSSTIDMNSMFGTASSFNQDVEGIIIEIRN